MGAAVGLAVARRRCRACSSASASTWVRFLFRGWHAALGRNDGCVSCSCWCSLMGALLVRAACWCARRAGVFGSGAVSCGGTAECLVRRAMWWSCASLGVSCDCCAVLARARFLVVGRGGGGERLLWSSLVPPACDGAVVEAGCRLCAGASAVLVLRPRFGVGGGRVGRAWGARRFVPCGASAGGVGARSFARPAQ